MGLLWSYGAKERSRKGRKGSLVFIPESDGNTVKLTRKTTPSLFKD